MRLDPLRPALVRTPHTVILLPFCIAAGEMAHAQAAELPHGTGTAASYQRNWIATLGMPI